MLFGAGGIVAVILFIGFIAYDAYIGNIPGIYDGEYAVHLKDYQAFEGEKDIISTRAVFN